jgi:hypothetical protein
MSRAHLGLFVDNLVMGIGCGVSKRFGDGVGEVNVVVVAP